MSSKKTQEKLKQFFITVRLFPTITSQDSDVPVLYDPCDKAAFVTGYNEAILKMRKVADDLGFMKGHS